VRRGFKGKGMQPILEISNLGKAFSATTVLADVSLALMPGERLAVIGSSGSGKTTLLRLIAGLEAPTAGEIRIAGNLVSRAGEIVVAPEYREVALVFQGLALFPHLRALAQIGFAAKGRGGFLSAKSLLDRIGLGHRADAKLDELSGGERQRIALARAIAQEPKLILMDEPFSSLDDEKRGEMRNLLRSLLDSTQTTLILVTHSRDDALDLAHRALVLDRGRPVAQDWVESILINPNHTAAVRAFGLGQIVEGTVRDDGRVKTVFGNLTTHRAVSGAGRVRLLIRPAQPRMLDAAQGVEAEVIGVELRPPETSEIRRVAVVRIGENVLRVFVRDGRPPVPGQRFGVVIDGSCDIVDG
jgi:iron(III) transport system ATP-binding protein